MNTRFCEICGAEADAILGDRRVGSPNARFDEHYRRFMANRMDNSQDFKGAHHPDFIPFHPKSDSTIAFRHFRSMRRV